MMSKTFWIFRPPLSTKSIWFARKLGTFLHPPPFCANVIYGSPSDDDGGGFLRTYVWNGLVQPVIDLFQTMSKRRPHGMRYILSVILLNMVFYYSTIQEIYILYQGGNSMGFKKGLYKGPKGFLKRTYV